MRRWLGVLLTFCMGVSVPLWAPPPLQAADVLITFDDLPAPQNVERPLRNEYQAQGVIFGWSPTASNARTVYLLKPTGYAAHSGSQVGLIEQSGHCGVENPNNDAWARFTSLRHHVQVYVTSLLGEGTVVLQGVSAGGQAVAGTSAYVRAGEWKLLSITRAQGDIAFIHILGNPPSTGCIAIDDLSFDAPVGAGPDFGLAFYALDIGASPGHSGTGTIVVNRFSNSSGRIDFSTSGLPPGVSASFSPQPLTGSSLSANVTLTLHVAGNAPAAVDVPVTVTGKALDPSAGDPAQPRSVVIPVTVASEYTLVVKGIEVTQGVQVQVPHRVRNTPAVGTLTQPLQYGGVILHAGRRTVVRVFVRALNFSGLLDGVHAALYAYDANNRLLPGPNPILPDADGSVAGLAPGTLEDTDEVTYAERIDKVGTPFEFTLPPSWTAGAITLRAVVTPPPQASFDTPTDAACDTPDCLRLEEIALSGVGFHPTKSITVVTVMANNGSADLFLKPDIVFAPALRLTPGNITVTDYQGDIEMIDIGSSSDQRDDKSSQALDRIEDWDEDNDYPGQMVIGVTANGKDDLGMENSEVAYDGRPRAVVDQWRSLTSVAHELNHGLGRPHASSDCGADPSRGAAEGWPPDESGEIQGVGVDTYSGAPHAIKAPPGLGPNAQPRYFDFMSYCAGFTRDASHGDLPIDKTNVWISYRGWDEVMTRYVALIPRPARLLARTLVRIIEGAAAAALEITAAAGPDTGGLALAPVLPAPPPGGTGLVEITGYTSASGTRITRVRPAAQERPLPPSLSPYSVRILDAAGRPLADTPMTVRTAHVDPSPAGPGGAVTFLRAVVPSDRAAKAVITRNGVAVAERTRAPHPPVVTLIAPTPESVLGGGGTIAPRPGGGTGGATLVRWDARHPDGNALYAKVDYSIDAGRAWRTVYSGPNRNQTQIPNAFLSGSGPGQARIRIRVNDGFNESSVVSGPLTAVGSAPSVRIEAPLDKQRFRADAVIALQGRAFDDAFQPVAPDGLAWSVDGRIMGRGGTATATGLAPGTHEIRLTARDAHGRQSAASITITVLPVKPLFLQLAPPKEVPVSGGRVTLMVASTVPAALQVEGRDVAQVDRTPRPVPVEIPAGTGPAMIRLRLTAFGESTATTLVIRRRAP